MDECANCGFVLYPGERTCPECGLGGPEWTPDDRDDPDPPRPYRATRDGNVEVFAGP